MESVKDQEPESEEASEEEFSEEDEEVDDPEGTVHKEADEIEEQESKSEELPSGVPEPVDNDNDGPDGPNRLKMEDLAIEDCDEGGAERACDDGEKGPNMRQLSVSPHKLRRDLPQGGDEEGGERDQDHRARRIKEIVSNDVAKMKAKEQRKYHSKKSVRSAGRPQGSKAKQDRRVKLSEHTAWT